MKADDRLSPDSVGSVEGGDGIVESSHVADVCPQLTIPKPLDEPNYAAKVPRVR